VAKDSSTLRRALSLLSLAGLIGTVSLGSTWAADAGPDRSTQRVQHHQAWVRARLDRDANRLEIKASQQSAWQQYANARMAFAERPSSKLAHGADAATIAKTHAQRAAEIAQKLAVLSDATSGLQVVLSPEQRVTLDQIARHHHHRHAHHGRGEARDGLRGDGQEGASDPGQPPETPPA